MAVSQRLFMLIVGIWVGGLIALGLLVAPTIFNVLNDKQVAGMIAGEIFKNASFVNLIAGIFLLIYANLLVKRNFHHFRQIRWGLLCIILLTLAGTFLIAPQMSALRETALSEGFPVMQSPYAKDFAKLHMISNAIFFIELATGVWICWRSSKVV